MIASPGPKDDDPPSETRHPEDDSASPTASQQARPRALEPTLDRGGSDDGPDRRKAIHNEQVKLTATFCNGLALAFAGGGGVTAVLGLRLPGIEGQFVLAIVWIAVGFTLHSVGRLILRTMR